MDYSVEYSITKILDSCRPETKTLGLKQTQTGSGREGAAQRHVTVRRQRPAVEAGRVQPS